MSAMKSQPRWRAGHMWGKGGGAEEDMQGWVTQGREARGAAPTSSCGQ